MRNIVEMAQRQPCIRIDHHNHAKNSLRSNMKLSLQNIGQISHAEIEIADITVIAGENDTGKSTVGKVLFSSFQSLLNHNLLGERRREVEIQKNLQDMLFSAMRHHDPAKENAGKIASKIRRLLTEPKPLTLATLSSIKEMLEDLDLPAEKRSWAKAMQQIEKLLTEEVAFEESFRASLLDYLNNEFSNELCKKNSSGGSSVSLKDGEHVIFDYSITANEISKCSVEPISIFEDVTLIEGSDLTLLQMANPLPIRTVNLRWPLHLTDLLNKLKVSSPNIQSPITENLNAEYKGQFGFDVDTQKFLLNKGKYSVSDKNIASGIKALGKLDLLIKNGFAGSRDLLILDEPETNLHPKWQVLYAELLVRAANSADAPKIIISTHSPYIIEALYHFAVRNRSDAKINFYSAKKDSDGAACSFEDLGSNIDEIMESLAAPLKNMLGEE